MEQLSTPSRRPRTKIARRVASPRTSWWAAKSPVFWFVARFLGVVAVFYALSLTPVFQAAQAAYLTATARGAYAGLQAMGVGCHMVGETIWSTKCSITVGPQCSAIELAWFLAGAMLAFPATWLRRVGGIAAGLSVLAVLNIVRVGSLYVVGVHAPGQFAWMHESAWPGLLILATVAMMGVWIGAPRSAAVTEEADASA